MASNMNALYRLLAEHKDFILFESVASDQAKQLGLHYAGFGYWADKDNHIVARTIDGKLVKLAPGDVPLHHDLEPGKVYEPDGSPDDDDPDSLTVKSVTPEKALTDLTTTAIQFAGLNPKNKKVASEVSKMILLLAATGEIPSGYHFLDMLEQGEKEGLLGYLDVLAKNKHSKAMKALGAFMHDLKPAKGEEEPIPSITAPAEPFDHKGFSKAVADKVAQQLQPPHVVAPDGSYKKAAPAQPPAAPATPGVNTIDWSKAAKIVGIDPETVDPETWAKFVAIMKKAEEAETSVQINYIRALLKKSGLLGATKPQQWAKWKEMLRFIKQSKQNLIKGPKEKGKIKNKQAGLDAPTDDLETPDEPTGEPQFDAVAYANWWESQSNEDQDFIKNVFSNWLGETGYLASDLSMGTQAAIAQAIGAALKDKSVVPLLDFAQQNIISYPDKLIDVFTSAEEQASKDEPLAKSVEKYPGIAKISLDYGTIKALQQKSVVDRHEILAIMSMAVEAPSAQDMMKQLNHLNMFGLDEDTLYNLNNAVHMLWQQEHPENGLGSSAAYLQQAVDKLETYLNKEYPTISYSGLADQLSSVAVEELNHLDGDDADQVWGVVNAALHSWDAKSMSENLQDFNLLKGVLTNDTIKEMLNKTHAVWEKEKKVTDAAIANAAQNPPKSILDIPLSPEDSQPSKAEPSVKAPANFDSESDTFSKHLDAFEKGVPYAEEPAQAPTPSTAPEDQGEPNTPEDDLNLKTMGVLNNFYKATQTGQDDYTEHELAHLENNIPKILSGQIKNDTGTLETLFNFLGGGDVFKLQKALAAQIKTSPNASALNIAFSNMLDDVGLTALDFTDTDRDTIFSVGADVLSSNMTIEDAKKALGEILSKQEILSYLEQVITHKHNQQQTTAQTPEASKTADNKQAAADKYEFKFPAAVKSAATSLSKPWSKGDPSVVLNWFKSKMEGKGKPTPHPVPKTFWQDAAMALVKNHGVPLSQVPESLIPDEVKNAMAATPTQEETEESAVEKVLGKFMSILPKEANITPADQAQIVDALNIAINTGDEGKLEDLANTTDLDAIQIHALKQILNGQEPTKLIAPAAPQTQEDKNKGKEVSHKEAVSYVDNFLASAGIQFSGLSGENKVKLTDATKEALNATSEFGVVYAFEDLDEKNVIPQDALDALKYNILEKVGKEKTLDTSEEAFKKYLNPKTFVDEFLATNGAFAAALTPEEKQKLYTVAAQGLAFSGPKGYAEAKALYQKELVGKVPGFSEAVFTNWRHGLMKYHDKLKNMAQFIQQKKTELEQKIKEAEETKKALAAISSGDTAQQINAIMSAIGASDPKAKLAIAKALAAPTSQQAMDHLFTLMSDYSAYASNPEHSYYGKTSAIPADKQKMMRNLVSAAWFEQHHKMDISGVEPKVNEPVTQRFKHVLDNWLAKYGMTLGHVPSSNGEKKTVQDAIVQALTEPDPKKVNNILSGLLVTATSLGDKHINQLRQLVHQERKKPASVHGTPAVYQPKPYTAGVSAPANTKVIHGDVSGDKEFVSKFKYYNLPEHKKKDIHDAVFSTLAKQITTFNRGAATTELETQLKHVGLDAATAHKVALWATREAKDNGELAQKAKKIMAVAGVSGVTPVSASNLDAKQKLLNIPSHNCANSLVKTEFVPGEQIKFSDGEGHLAPLGNDSLGPTDATTQDKWRHATLPKEMVKQFNEAATSWQGSSQWVKAAPHRKAMNEIMTRIVEGPPPLYANASGALSRGINMTASDFPDFIKAFQIGKPVYIGPSGFSSNLDTAKSFGHWKHGQDANYTKVIIRALPNKAGKIKGVRLANRTGPGASQSHNSEAEIVIGTGRHFVCTNVIKHVVKAGYGDTYHAAYEIHVQFDENLTEALQLNGGFRADLWKGLDKNTVKAIIKYMNSPVRFAGEK